MSANKSRDGRWDVFGYVLRVLRRSLKEFLNHLISAHNSRSSYYIQKSQALTNLGFKFNFSNISKSADDLIRE